MKTKRYIVLATIFLLAGFLVCAPSARALYMTAYSNAGYAMQTYPQQSDWTDGWEGDYIAEVYYANPGEPITTPGDDYAYTKASLTGTGVELKSKAYAPDTYALSRAMVNDYFTLSTITGSGQALLNATMNFNLTGSIALSNIAGSEGSIQVVMFARQEDAVGSLTFLDIKVIEYIASWSSAGVYTGGNATDNSHPYAVTPTISGSNFYFDVPLSLDLDDMLADVPVQLEISMYAKGRNATTDFSNTFATSQDNPFLITSSLPGTSYWLDTGYDQIEGIGLFGSLDGETVGGPTGGNPPIPEPSTFLLLGGGLAGLALYRRKRN